MARPVDEARMDSREARRRLGIGRKLHVRMLASGKSALCYRHRRRDAPGTWLLRRYTGNPSNPYEIETLGTADDIDDADGHVILTFDQAQSLARERAGAAERRGPLMVKQAVADYLGFLRTERKTAKDAERRANIHILPALGSRRITDLTTDELVRWRDGLVIGGGLLRSRKGGKPKRKAEPITADQRRARQASANRVLTTLKAALNRAFKMGLVQDDLAWRRVPSFRGVQAARPGHLSVMEAQRLLNAADAESGFRNLAHAGLLTGCRYGELCRLRVRDYGNGRIAIHESKSGRPRDVVLTNEGVEFFDQLAAGRGRDEFLLQNLGRIHRARQAERERAARADEQPNYTEIDADPGDWRPSEQSRPMLAACKAARIVPAVGFHALRHTWASLSVMNGMSLLLVARNLGHTDTRMVELHYGKLAESYITTEIRRAAPRFGAIQPTSVVSIRDR